MWIKIQTPAALIGPQITATALSIIILLNWRSRRLNVVNEIYFCTAWGVGVISKQMQAIIDQGRNGKAWGAQWAKWPLLDS